MFAGYVAARMGLPVERLIVATNVNDILARTLADGVYEPRGVVPTASPAMDIQVSSNFERLLFDATGRNAPAVKAMMAELAQAKRFALPAGALKSIRERFSAARADEQETMDTIKAVHAERNYVLDPHSAVGVAVARKLEEESAAPVVALSTAHPAKFPDAVEAATGIRPQLPATLSDLLDRAERFTRLPASADAVARFVLERSRATAGVVA